MLAITGKAGDGPVESEVELTDGKPAKSQVSLEDVHAEYQAAAEEAIESETIPLSDRLHVKRYFKAIKPTE